MSAGNPPDRPRARDDVVFRQLDEEWVVFDPTVDRMHALNLTAALVWSQLDGERSLAQVAEAVATAFATPVDAQSILPDVEEAIARFAREGLLE